MIYPQTMNGNDKPEPTQKTPKGEEIPIPTRKDFIDTCNSPSMLPLSPCLR